MEDLAILRARTAALHRRVEDAVGPAAALRLVAASEGHLRSRLPSDARP